MPNYLESHFQCYSLRFGDFVIELQIKRRWKEVECERIPVRSPDHDERSLARPEASQDVP